MLFVCDFFTRHKEAVSNQIELLATHSSGTVLAATRFMKQRPLQKSELSARIIILPAWLYNATLPLVLALSNRPVHYFEEEPSAWKRFLFNLRKRRLYVSMYRRPDKEYAAHVANYKHLQQL